MDEFDFWTVQAMVKYGGSFVKGLAAAAAHADRHNLKKIKETWPNYWNDYQARGQKLRFEVCSFGMCDGSKELVTDEDDGEGHTQVGVGTRPCPCAMKK